MADDVGKDKGRVTAAAAREVRLAAELRANLKRRKAHQRGLDQGAAQPQPGQPDEAARPVDSGGAPGSGETPPE